MATIAVAPAVEVDSVAGTVAEGACPVCGHPLDAHDVISARYCTATQAGGLPRGCICPPGS